MENVSSAVTTGKLSLISVHAVLDITTGYHILFLTRNLISLLLLSIIYTVSSNDNNDKQGPSNEFSHSDSCWNISCLLYSSPTKVVAFPPSPPICNGAIGGKDYRFLATVAVVTHNHRWLASPSYEQCLHHICIHCEPILICSASFPSYMWSYIWNAFYCEGLFHWGWELMLICSAPDQKFDYFNSTCHAREALIHHDDQSPSVIFSCVQCVRTVLC